MVIGSLVQLSSTITEHSLWLFNTMKIAQLWNVCIHCVPTWLNQWTARSKQSIECWLLQLISSILRYTKQILISAATGMCCCTCCVCSIQIVRLFILRKARQKKNANKTKIYFILKFRHKKTLYLPTLRKKE